MSLVQIQPKNIFGALVWLFASTWTLTEDERRKKKNLKTSKVLYLLKSLQFNKYLLDCIIYIIL